MQYSSTLLLLLGAFTSVSLAAPAIIVIEDASTPTTPDAASPAEPAASATSTKPAAGSSAGTGSTGACSSAVMALAQGIQSNIDDQNNELTTVTALGNVLAQNPVDATLYSATQSSLLGFVTKGITIRENNQKIAPQGNPALPGLATVAMAQMTELNLTMSLAVPASGQIDVAGSNTTVEALKGDFKGGIVQNMKNLAAAMTNCTAPAAAGGAGTKATPSPSSTVNASKEAARLARGVFKRL
ncbi:uncharacterized protein PAC_10570 [Phialocephala subalpina]|uniref:Cell wall protein n=1 Tax=Phialocephala subalpina TaxID=576137 RepID=A0A1L7X6N7_9HELO|nr:uncharacterized protein PAC_10570 [Phialocephala subalpina]